MFFQIFGLGMITIIVYVFVTMLTSLITACDDYGLVFGMAYFIGAALFVTLMICWATGVQCQWALQ